jgi:hypothetical protein
MQLGEMISWFSCNRRCQFVKLVQDKEAQRPILTARHNRASKSPFRCVGKAAIPQTAHKSSWHGLFRRPSPVVAAAPSMFPYFPHAAQPVDIARHNTTASGTRESIRHRESLSVQMENGSLKPTETDNIYTQTNNSQ